MQHRPPRPRPTGRRAASARSSTGLARRRRALLAVAVALGSTAGAALVGHYAATAPSAVEAVDAASSRALSATGVDDAGTAADAASADAAQAQSAAEPGNGPRHQGDHEREAAQPDAPAEVNCSLLVPPAPTSAAGLATPYELLGADGGEEQCHETNADQSAFVEAAVYDPGNHSVSIYHPLVVDRGDEPAVAPVPVTLPAGAVVGIWFGFNGDTLTLRGPGAASCVNGLPDSPFGQFAYCNAAPFFAAATADTAFLAKIPQLSRSPKDKLPCPTSRDFSVVDQDQSDNLATIYRVVGDRMAQDTAGTAARGTKLTNGSDEGLVARFIAPALGCKPFTAPDLTDGGRPTPALALNELLAAARQGTPVALVPTSDPMVQVDGEPSQEKTNLYRAGVGQPGLPEGQTPEEYCTDIVTLGSARLDTDSAFFEAAAAPDDGAANLLAFLRDRLQGTLEELGCAGGQQDAEAAGSGDTAADTAAADAAGAGATEADPADTGTGTGTADSTSTGAAGGTTGEETAPATGSDDRRHRRPTAGTAGASPSSSHHSTAPASSGPVSTDTGDTTTDGSTTGGTTTGDTAPGAGTSSAEKPTGSTDSSPGAPTG